jgi:hypothetical protein
MMPRPGSDGRHHGLDILEGKADVWRGRGAMHDIHLTRQYTIRRSAFVCNSAQVVSTLIMILVSSCVTVQLNRMHIECIYSNSDTSESRKGPPKFRPSCAKLVAKLSAETCASGNKQQMAVVKVDYGKQVSNPDQALE